MTMNLQNSPKAISMGRKSGLKAKLGQKNQELNFSSVEEQN